jgi:hypothetical protein
MKDSKNLKLAIVAALLGGAAYLFWKDSETSTTQNSPYAGGDSIAPSGLDKPTDAAGIAKNVVASLGDVVKKAYEAPTEMSVKGQLNMGRTVDITNTRSTGVIRYLDSSGAVVGGADTILGMSVNAASVAQAEAANVFRIASGNTNNLLFTPAAASKPATSSSSAASSTTRSSSSNSSSSRATLPSQSATLQKTVSDQKAAGMDNASIINNALKKLAGK